VFAAAVTRPFGNPKPFIWTKDADLILRKVERLSKQIYRSLH